MKRNNKQLNALIDSTAAKIRDEQLDPSIIEGASQRVWARLADEGETQAAVARAAERSIEGCGDYQSLIPAYLRRELSPARKLLLEDHTGECVPCRRALKQARTHESNVRTVGGGRNRGAAGGVIPWGVFPGKVAGSFAHLRVAAALLVTFALIGYFVWRPFGGGAFGGVVQAADGMVYRVADEESRAISNGEAVKENESIRTARDAHASFRLADGSLVEMRERSQFSLAENRRGSTINVERGNFIVQMPQEGSKALYVATDDALISANGATLAVASGTKGTRVSVISGAATVDSGGASRELKAGEQFTSRANLETVPLKDDVRWSRDAARYDNLIASLQATRADVDARAARPGVRHSTRLLDLAPADTVFYVALPNWSRTLTDARTILQERVNENAALRDWWQKRQTTTGKGREDNFDVVLDRVGAWGEQLKDEIVVTAGRNQQGTPDRVLLLTETKDPARFRAFLSEQISKLDGAAQSRVHIIDDPATATPVAGVGERAHEVYVWLHDDLVAVSTGLDVLRELNARLVGAGQTQASFAGSSLHSRLTDLYREGTSLIIAADLERVMADSFGRQAGAAAKSAKSAEQQQREAESFRQTGFSEVRHFIIESKDASDLTMNRAVLTFNGERRGMASWLAAPAPMGSLDFISREASMAAAFVVKEPTAVVGDFFEFLKTTDPNIWQTVSEAQAANGIDIRRDLAAPLGGEFAFAVDGPLLPVPSWKLVFEVDDPAGLNRTLERLVAKVNEVAAREGKRGFVTEREQSGDQTFYSIKSLDLGLSVHYTYANNYLVMTPSRALLDRALRFREAKATLTHAPRFTAALPTDGVANFSALFYQDLGGVLDPLARTMRGFGVSPDGKKKADADSPLGALNTLSPPALAYARADANSIVFAAPTKGGPFGVTPSTFLGLPGGMSLGSVFEHGMGGGTERR